MSCLVIHSSMHAIYRMPLFTIVFDRDGMGKYTVVT